MATAKALFSAYLLGKKVADDEKEENRKKKKNRIRKIK